MRQPSLATAALPLGIFAAVALSSIVLSGQAPAVVGQGGITSPQPITQGKPSYTPAAMRARIEGTARVTCIVEVDGTVSGARITRSLDAVNGLDEEAIKAVNEWRFKPGMRNGVPVRVQVAIDVQFSLRGPASTMPAAFGPAAASNPAFDDEPWTVSGTGVGDSRLRFMYPEGWAETPALGNASFVVTKTGQPWVLAVGPGRPSTRPRASLVSDKELDALAILLRQSLAANGSTGDVVSRGQALLSSRVWYWLEISAHAPPGVNQRARVWTFVTFTGTEQVTATCTVVFPVDATDGDIEHILGEAGPDFARMLRRMLVQTP
jgi:TonB family protein